MKRTRVRLSGEESMKSSARGSKPLARDRAVGKLQTAYALNSDHVTMCALRMAKKQGDGWRKFASRMVLTKAFRYVDLLAPTDSRDCSGRSCVLPRPILRRGPRQMNPSAVEA
jgi:hypothetical protein